TSGVPLNHSCPSRGRTRPLTTLSNVDLPEPLGPTMHVTPPWGTLKSTPLMTSPPPYPATTPSKRRNAVDSAMVPRFTDFVVTTAQARVQNGGVTSSFAGRPRH